MSLYNSDDEYGSNNWSASKIVGIFLTFIGAGVIIWTVVGIFQLFTHGSAFITLDQIIPERIVISENVQSTVLLPRFLLVYGIPIWALTVTTKLGVLLMKNGLQFLELPRRGAAKPLSN